LAGLGQAWQALARLLAISQALTRRVKELAERYGTPLRKLSSQLDDLQAKVDTHLLRMGFVWA